MGQQQLLLLVLGIVVVALATVIAINMLGEKNDESGYDAITSEALNIAGDILSWKATPISLGGGMGAEYLTGLTFQAIGYTATNGSGSRANNEMFMRSINQLTTPLPYIVVRPRANSDLRVQLFLYGPNPNCYRLRRSRRVDGDWINAKMDVGQGAVPTGCNVW